MKLTDSESLKCKECGTITTHVDEVHGCDGCKAVLDRTDYVLEVTVFRKAGHDDNSTLEFCSWACAFKVLPKIETDYFVTLPYLQYEPNVRAGARASDFFAAVRKFK